MFGLIWFGSSALFYLGAMYIAREEYKRDGYYSINLNTISAVFLIGLLGPLALLAGIYVTFGDAELVFEKKEDK